MKTGLHVRWDYAAAVAATLVALALAVWQPGASDLDDRAIAAARTMAKATASLADYRRTFGPALSPEDVHSTGLIGEFFTPLTTTVSSVDAKRTTTNPNFAALALCLLDQAGVQPGDAIAVGASGSFPALLLAVLCAADALDLDVGLIVSLGASQWGANLPGFTWLEMQEVLLAAGLLPAHYRAEAASLGGAQDVGLELAPDVRASLRSRIARAGALVIEEPRLEANVVRRMQIYSDAAAGRTVSAFVNIGGAWANVGIAPASLDLEPGVAHIVEGLPPPEERGTVFAFASQGVPIIHLLHIAELAAQFGLPWDPSPLPSPGVTPALSARAGRAETILAATYTALAVVWMVSLRLRARRSSRH